MNISIFPLSLFNDMTNGPLECNITSAGDVPGGVSGQFGTTSTYYLLSTVSHPYDSLNSTLHSSNVLHAQTTATQLKIFDFPRVILEHFLSTINILKINHSYSFTDFEEIQ